MDAVLLTDLLAASVRIATPLLLAALGGILSERSSTFAVAIEGMMLAGAFGAAIAAMAAGAPAGLLASAAAGMLVASLVAVATTRFSTDQMVTGLAVNILMTGLTSYPLRALAGGRTPVVRFPVLAPWPVPLLGDVPVLGPVLFRQPPLTYLAVPARGGPRSRPRPQPGRPPGAGGRREPAGGLRHRHRPGPGAEPGTSASPSASP